MNILIDERIRNKEEDFLKNELNLNVEKIRLSSFVYPEISGHSDIFYAKINNKIYCSPNAPIKNPSFIIGKEEVKNTNEKATVKKVRLYNVVDFVKGALGSGLYPNLTKVQASGFISLMRSKDMYYVEDEMKFKEELDKFVSNL